MKVFLAYRATGEDENTLLTTLRTIVAAFDSVGVETYCTHLHGEAVSKTSKMKLAFEKIDGSDALVVFVQDANKSEGMLLEIGYAYGKKPIHILAKEGIDLASFELADSILRWRDLEHLTGQIKEHFE